MYVRVYTRKSCQRIIVDNVLTSRGLISIALSARCHFTYHSIVEHVRSVYCAGFQLDFPRENQLEY